jgi:hypothetical protein
MTFEQFQSTRTYSDDLGATLQDGYWEHYETPATGYIYLDVLWIERDPKQDTWGLTIGREIYTDAALEPLERRLYQFACDEGYIILP